MTDVIYGMGEVGSAIFKLLIEKKIDTLGYDRDTSKIMNDGLYDVANADFLHICIPYSDNFGPTVLQAISEFNPKVVIIHSTVSAGTTHTISEMIDNVIPIMYSPIRGVHERFLQDLKRYDKFIAPNLPAVIEELKNRFENIIPCDDAASLELAKIMETTYYGYLIAFRKEVDEQFNALGMDSDVFWSFCVQIDEYLANRPIMFNDGEKIGGHCVIPNLKLLPKEFDSIKKVVKKWG